MSAKRRKELINLLRHPVPWLVKERDLWRYLGRALDACACGRVVYFYHRMIQRSKERRVLMALVPCKDDALSAALVDLWQKRFRRVTLADLPRRTK